MDVTIYEVQQHSLTHNKQKDALTPAKQEIIHLNIAFNLGQIALEFQSGRLQERDVFNAEETLLDVHLKTNRVLDKKGDHDGKYEEVFSGDEEMKMMVLLRGGGDGGMGASMMIFKNQNSSYPIRGFEEKSRGCVIDPVRKGG